MGMKASQLAGLITPRLVDRVTLRLPWPPSVNDYWGKKIMRKKSGAQFIMVFVARAGQQFLEKAAAMIIEQRSPRVEGRIAVMIHVFPPTRAARDLDNLGKAALDALKSCKVIEDDSYIDLLRFRRRAVRPGGELVVSIRRIDPQGELF